MIAKLENLISQNSYVQKVTALIYRNNVTSSEITGGLFLLVFSWVILQNKLMFSGDVFPEFVKWVDTYHYALGVVMGIFSVYRFQVALTDNYKLRKRVTLASFVIWSSLSTYYWIDAPDSVRVKIYTIIALNCFFAYIFIVMGITANGILKRKQEALAEKSD